MKKNILLTLFLLGSAISYVQSQNPENQSKICSFNNADKADAYSWISRNGKRIYYTKDDSKEEIWMAERPGLNHAFQNPVAIKIEGLSGNVEIFSSWLTPDESTLYFITRESDETFNTFLYKANFNKAKASFVNPQKINLDLGSNSNESSIFISGPSLSNDLSELFVYFSSDDNKDRLAFFEGTDGSNYTFRSFVNNADNYCPGTLSEDGLSFYLTLRSENNILVKLSRSHTHTEFSNPEYFVIDTMRNHGKNYYQPHINASLGILSITYGTGSWQSNDIDIIEIPKTKANEFQPLISEETLSSIDAEEYKQPMDEEILALTDTAIIPRNLNETLNPDTFIQVNSTEIESQTEETHIDLNRKSSEIRLDKNDLNIQLYPNPANEIINLISDFGENHPSEIQVDIIDLTGKVIYTEQISLPGSDISIATSNLKEGIYFCRITVPGIACKNKKFIIDRN